MGLFQTPSVNQHYYFKCIVSEKSSFEISYVNQLQLIDFIKSLIIKTYCLDAEAQPIPHYDCTFNVIASDEKTIFIEAIHSFECSGRTQEHAMKNAETFIHLESSESIDEILINQFQAKKLNGEIKCLIAQFADEDLVSLFHKNLSK